jgi:serine-type D-Ala-D-Ala carboxypeptidase (penicillin-binding protein 5/6)
MSVLQEGRARQRPRRRPRKRRRTRRLIAVLVLTIAALLGVLVSEATGPSIVPLESPAIAPKPAHAKAPTRSSYGVAAAPAAQRVTVKLKLPLRSGLLFDVDTGRVLWARNPNRVVAIASLTKIMTALVVVAHALPGAEVPITRDALRYTGSGVGLLPKGKQVLLSTLLYGLLLPSGNDAAIAMADYVAGTQARFIALMNDRARQLGLTCTHFTSVSGIVDRGNHSCAQDLALLAHLLLKRPLLARIVGSRSAILPFPIKGGKLFLYNNNPLLILRYPGTDGVKTGFTDAAGQCLLATARRGNRWLGVVLLHSGDASIQAQQILNAGFAQHSQT